MKARYLIQTFNRSTLLLAMLLTFTFSKAQDLVPYQIDTTFAKTIYTLAQDGKFRTYCDTLEKRIYETAEKKAFFDFDYALLNYFTGFNNAGYSNQEKEDALHRLYHFLPELEVEYAFVLGNYMRNRFNLFYLFSMYDESKEWKLKDEVIKFEEVANINSVKQEIDDIALAGFTQLINYQYPHDYSKNFTYLDYYISHKSGYQQFPEEYKMLYDYHKKYQHQYELIQLDLSAIRSLYYKKADQEKWSALDSLYQTYVSVRESEWILSELYKMTKNAAKAIKCDLTAELVELIMGYKKRFDAKQGSQIDVIYHQLINPEFSVNFNERNLKNRALTFSVESRNIDTLYYNIYSYEDAFTNSDSKNLRINKSKMTLVSSRILLLDKKESCFSEKHFLQEKLEGNDNYIFTWTDEPAFFDSLTTKSIDQLTDFNFEFRVYTFDKFIAHEILNQSEGAIHLLLRDNEMNLLEGVEVYAYGTKETYKDGETIKKEVDKYLGKTDKNGVLSSKLDMNLNTLQFKANGVVQTEPYRKYNYSYSDEKEKTPFFEKIGFYFLREDRIDLTEFIIHTDRNKYKPGQTVHFKAIAYLLDDYDNLFEIIKNHPFEVVVKDPNGKNIYSTEMKLNQWGSLSGQFEIPKDAVLGEYILEVNDWSDYQFSVEEYKEKRAKIVTNDIEKLYVAGDSVRISGNILTNTNTGIQNALVTIYKGKEEIGTMQSDSQGAFHFDVLLDTLEKDGYRSFDIKAILGSGEVLTTQKSLSVKASKYNIRFYKNPKTDFLHLRVANNDNSIVPHNDIQYKIKQYKKTSAFYTYSDVKTDFTYEEYVRLLPDYHIFEEIEKTSFHQLKTDSINIKKFLEVYEEKRFEMTFFYVNESADTIVIKEYKIKDVIDYEDLPFAINHLGEIRGHIQTSKTYLVLYKKKNLIVKTSVLNQREIETLDGLKLLKKYESIVIIDPENRYLSLIGFSRIELLDEIFSIQPIEMEKEVHPGQDYEFKFEILNRKGKRLKNVELLAYMCKSEFFNWRNYTYLGFLDEAIDIDYNWHRSYGSNYFQKEPLNASFVNSYKGYSDSRKKFNPALVRNKEEIIVYSSPLINRDAGATGYTVTREDIANLPIRTASGVSTTIAGVEEIYGISVRGSRESPSYYYIDGIKVRGSANLPKLSIMEEESDGVLHEVNVVAYKSPENTDFRAEGMSNYQIPRERTNFEETVFFQPKIRSNAKGIYTVKFKQNDDVNNYAFYLFGHNKKLKTGEFKTFLNATLPVNIQVNKPRFIRERDEIVFKNALYNETKDTLVGRVDFFLSEKDDSVALNSDFQTEFMQEVTILPFSMKTVDWKLVVPENSPSELTFIVQLLSNVGSDIYIDDMTVLNNRMENLASLPIFKLNTISQDYEFDELTQIPESAQLKGAFVYLDEDNAWNALKKFAEVMTKDYQVTNYQVAQLYSALMFKYLLESQPRLTDILSKHIEKISEDKSQLLMNENPYDDFKGYGSDEEIILLMQELKDTTVLEDFISKRIKELKLAQNSDGGFPWYKGGNSNIFITNYIFTTLNRLAQYNINTDFDFKEKTREYLDKLYENNWEKAMYIRPSFEAQILWLMNKAKLAEKIEKEILRFEEELFSTWQVKDPYHKSLIGQLALKRGKIDVARKIRGSLLDISKMRNNLGRIFNGLNANDQGRTIAATIRFLEQFNPKDEEIKNFGIGLRAQQAYTNNTSYLSALEYWDALLLSHKKEELMQGEVVVRLANNEEITFSPSSEKIKNIPLEKIDHFQKIQVESKKEDLVTGGIIIKYEDDIENMFKSSGDEIRIQRVIFVKEKGEYRRLKEGENLPLGSEIQVEINIINQEEIEYMHLIIPKATGMELSAERSGYYWSQGFSYFVQLKNEVVDIFLERIPKGTSRIFFAAYLTSEGKLTMAPSTIQSFEHPALKASDTSFKINVSNIR